MTLAGFAVHGPFPGHAVRQLKVGASKAPHPDLGDPASANRRAYEERAFRADAVEREIPPALGDARQHVDLVFPALHEQFQDGRHGPHAGVHLHDLPERIRLPEPGWPSAPSLNARRRGEVRVVKRAVPLVGEYGLPPAQPGDRRVDEPAPGAQNGRPGKAPAGPVPGARDRPAGEAVGHDPDVCRGVRLDGAERVNGRQMAVVAVALGQIVSLPERDSRRCPARPRTGRTAAGAPNVGPAGILRTAEGPRPPSAEAGR